MNDSSFDWDDAKDMENQLKHGVSFTSAQQAFLDSKRIIAEDGQHSEQEQRYYCFGRDESGAGILTVRFTYRDLKIRIIGAGYWRKGKKIYEQANSI